jgi:hypothetical protein
MFFTVKCISDTRSSNSGDIERGYVARTYRAERCRDHVKIDIETPDGCDIEVIVDGSLGNYDRVYIENPSGKTVATFRPPLVGEGQAMTLGQPMSAGSMLGAAV